MLFVPATRWEVIAKAAASTADAVCIDLEDSVPAEQKEACRANVRRALAELDFAGKTRSYRINGVETPFAYRDLIDIVETEGDRVDEIMIPKVGGPEHVQFVARLLTQIEERGGRARRIGLQAQIETAAGYVWLREIAAASPRLTTLIFGAGDYSASLHMPTSGIGTMDANDATYPGHRYHAVMHAIVATARAHGLRCLDGPFAAVPDDAGLERSCRISRALGFDGKQCIHPAQLATVEAIFGGSVEEIAHARRVVEAFEKAAAEGKGAVMLDGTMIDEASVRIARVALESARAGGAG
jgi:citrate lyase subunit beta/citryl-CoA lyase